MTAQARRVEGAEATLVLFSIQVIHNDQARQAARASLANKFTKRPHHDWTGKHYTAGHERNIGGDKVLQQRGSMQHEGRHS